LQITWEFVGNVATDGISKSGTFSLNSYSVSAVCFISFFKNKNKNSHGDCILFGCGVVSLNK
jgi:hypothetical protein